MTVELFADNAITSLASSPAIGATSFTVAASSGFPAAVTGVSQFRVIIDTEIVTVTNVSGTTWTCVALAAAHTAAVPVTHVITAAGLDNFIGTAASSAFVPLSQRGAASGVATLDAGSLVPAAQIPGAGAWTAYTPTLTGCTASIIFAKYQQTGKSVEFIVSLEITAVTAQILVALPVPISADWRSGSIEPILGSAFAYDLSTSLFTLGINSILTASGMAQFYSPGGAGPWAAAVPFTWASGDYLRLHGSYEAA